MPCLKGFSRYQALALTLKVMVERSLGRAWWRGVGSEILRSKNHSCLAAAFFVCWQPGSATSMSEWSSWMLDDMGYGWPWVKTHDIPCLLLFLIFFKERRVHKKQLISLMMFNVKSRAGFWSIAVWIWPVPDRFSEPDWIEPEICGWLWSAKEPKKHSDLGWEPQENEFTLWDY